MNEGNSPTGNKVEAKRRGLDSILNVNEAILHRINTVRGRLEAMSIRLHGEQPEEACDSDKAPTSSGVMGQLYEVQQASLMELDRIDDCFGRIESTI